MRKVIDNQRPFQCDAIGWIAAAAQTVKALKPCLIGERGHPAKWLKSAATGSAARRAPRKRCNLEALENALSATMDVLRGNIAETMRENVG